MEEIRFTCRTITPLVMTGPDGKKPELRPPGIKASLRYWWRALNGHLSLKELRKTEGEIFGNNDIRSNVIIRILNIDDDLKTEEIALLPHKDKSFKTDAFCENQEFEVLINYTEKTIGEGDNQVTLNKDYIKNLLVLACTLGGWGKRSRRGFGSIEITKINDEEFTMPTTITEVFNTYFQSVNRDKFELKENKVISKSIKKNNSEEYPRVLTVQIGQNTKTLENISRATHTQKGKNNWEYQFSVGDGKNRLASPIYISLLSNNTPIITTLKTQERSKKIKVKGEFKEILSDVNKDLQNELKDIILK